MSAIAFLGAFVASIAGGVFLIATEHYAWAWVPLLYAGLWLPFLIAQSLTTTAVPVRSEGQR